MSDIPFLMIHRGSPETVCITAAGASENPMHEGGECRHFLSIWKEKKSIFPPGVADLR